MNNEKLQKIMDSSDFFDFINKEFDKTIICATIDKLAEFAFGSIEEALDEYINIKGVAK